MLRSAGFFGIVLAVIGYYWLTSGPPVKTPKELNPQYEYIIVGAGSAGSVLAARLSEEADVSVLLLEAGGEGAWHPHKHIPGLVPFLQQTDIDWSYKTVPQEFSLFTFTLELLRRGALSLWHWLTAHCGMSGSSNLSVPPLQQVVIASTQPRQRSAVRTEAPLACPEATHPAGPESSDEPVLTQRSSCTFPPNSTRSPLSEALQRSYSQPVRRRSDPNLEGSRRCRLAEMEGSTSAIRTEIDEGSGQDSLVILGADGRVRVSLHKENSPAHTSLPESLLERVKLRDVTQMFDRLNEPLGATGQPVVVWPLEDWRKKGGKSGWGEWRPENGLLGSVVHKWTPSNPVAAHRSHIGLVIMLVRMDDGEHFVPISEAAVDVLEV